MRLPASASLPLASCWPLSQQLLPVSATGGGRRCCAFFSLLRFAASQQILNIQEIHGIKVIKFCAPLPAEVVKNIAFQLRGEITENLFFVAGSTDAGKPMLTVMISDNLVAGGLKAGNLVKEAAKLIQGGGGGQPHFATAGGKNADGLPAAVEKVLELAGI